VGMSRDAFLVLPATSSLSLPAFFNDKMVLQRNVPVPVWGKSPAGSTVTVRFAGQQKSSVANNAGDWRVLLDPLAVTVNRTLEVSNGSESVVITNVAVGEVWFFGGQSNVLFPVRLSDTANEYSSGTDDSSLRVFRAGIKASIEPQQNVAGEWYSVTDSNVGDISAVAYYYARELRQELEVPVGVIVCAMGGPSAESWTSYGTLQTEPALHPFLQEWQERITTMPTEANSYSRPGALYNGTIVPLAPYPIQGVVWYQGESNVKRSLIYRVALPLLIADWRRLWTVHNPVPRRFYLIQLANYGKVDLQPVESDRAEVREAQQQVARQPGNSLVVTIDIGDPLDIHPKNKLGLARRLSDSALANSYGRSIEFEGPSFSSVRQDGGTLRLSFDSAAGLKTTCSDPDSIPGFAIAGADRQWKWAQVRIEGEEIVVSHPSIPEPVAVRYAWSSNPQATMYNRANLPMVPFRTDDWPRSTQLTP
jgi:sialate O-acetylesterase